MTVGVVDRSVIESIVGYIPNVKTRADAIQTTAIISNIRCASNDSQVSKETLLATAINAGLLEACWKLAATFGKDSSADEDHFVYMLTGLVFIAWKNAFHQKVSEAIAGRLGTINEVILNADIPLICDDVKQIIRYLVRTNRSSGFGGCNEVEECLTCRKDLIKDQIMRCDWCV